MLGALPRKVGTDSQVLDGGLVLSRTAWMLKQPYLGLCFIAVTKGGKIHSQFKVVC